MHYIIGRISTTISAEASLLASLASSTILITVSAEALLLALLALLTILTSILITV